MADQEKNGIKELALTSLKWIAGIAVGLLGLRLIANNLPPIKL